MLLKDLMNDFLVEGVEVLPQFLPPATDVTLCEKGFTDWEEVESPRRLIKDYQFTDRGLLFRFVMGLMKFEDILDHHAKIIVEHLMVRVEVYTHDIDDITELDTEYARYADALFDDVASQ